MSDVSPINGLTLFSWLTSINISSLRDFASTTFDASITNILLYTHFDFG
jgi:hypothetical protein